MYVTTATAMPGALSLSWHFLAARRYRSASSWGPGLRMPTRACSQVRWQARCEAQPHCLACMHAGCGQCYASQPSPLLVSSSCSEICGL